MKLLTTEQVLFIHDRLIEETGGEHGLRDHNLLESAVNRPRAGYGNVEFYPTLHDKAAVLMESLIRNHLFVDGNQRTGFAAAGTILALNGWDLIAGHDKAYCFNLRVAVDHPDAPRPSWEEISSWLMDQSRQRRDVPPHG